MNDMSLKAKLKSIAKEKNISAQAVLQNYLMNRFLFRLSISPYKDKFVIKGGMLISSIIGIEQRATMDLDATLRNIPLNTQTIENAFKVICAITSDDDLNFRFESIDPIRNDDEYGGYRVSFFAEFGKINAPMSMDISTGDIITPGAEKHVFKDMLDDSVCFDLWSYSLETVLAEKLETILSRGIDNTRPRDFYDVYKLSMLEYDRKVLKKAFEATASHRESFSKIRDYKSILSQISESKEMESRWIVYTKKMPYADGISFHETIRFTSKILSEIL